RAGVLPVAQEIDFVLELCDGSLCGFARLERDDGCVGVEAVATEVVDAAAVQGASVEVAGDADQVSHGDSPSCPAASSAAVAGSRCLRGGASDLWHGVRLRR